MRISLRKTFDFEAAHWLPTFPDGHKCRRLHGHSFKVDVLVEGEVDLAKGYLQDFGDLKAAIAPLQLRLDHYLLNEIEGLENPTAEMLAKWVFDRLKPSLPLLSSVRVHETCTTEAEYRGD
jgi:6-pyruvoyltetrahydropterin/6-carboxytetrahydropterin synthase